MSDSYTLFSEVIDNITEQEKQWIEEESIKMAAQIDLGSLCEMNWEKNKDGTYELNFYSTDYGDVEAIATMLRKFIAKFKPDAIYTFEFVVTCSEPEVGEFFGGAFVITNKKVYSMGTGDWCGRKVYEIINRREKNGQCY